MTSKSKRQTKRFAGIMTVFLLLAQMGALAQFQNMKPVDVNNDGRMDLIDVYNHNGNAEVRVRISTPLGFQTENWTGAGQGSYVERFNRTVRYEWLSQYYWYDLAEVQDFATKWMWSYNHDRPNMALGGFTPKQRLAMAA